MGFCIPDRFLEISVSEVPQRKRAKEDQGYQGFLSAVGMHGNRDPFPITAPRDVDYWADNREVLSKLIRAEGDALVFPSSRIHAFYGPLGGGKSFAISYLANARTRAVLMKHLPESYGSADFLAFPVAANYPLKVGNLTRGIYLGIFKKLFQEILTDENLFSSFTKTISNVTGAVGEAFRDASENVTMTLDFERSFAGVEKSEGYKLLTLEKSKLGSLKFQEDYVSAIKHLVEPVLRKYRRVVIGIDELETLRQVSGTERLFFNDFLRRLHQDIDTGLTIILIFTLQSFDDVQSILQPAIISRISETINFGYVTRRKDIEEYIVECFSDGAGLDAYEIFDKDALEALSDDLLRKDGEVTFRDVNKQLHKIFAALLGHFKPGAGDRVTKATYESTKKPIPVEDIIRDLAASSRKN